MPDSIESLTKINRNDYYIRVCGKEVSLWWRRAMSAAAGEPVGRKAYWSPKDKEGGGERIDG